MNRHALVTHGVNVRPHKPHRESCEPEHNALRSRGTPNPDRGPARRRRKAQTTVHIQRPVVPHGFAVETVRRQWQAAVAEVRRLKAAGQDWSAAASEARALRARLVQLDPELVVATRTVEVTGSDWNPVKAV